MTSPTMPRRPLRLALGLAAALVAFAACKTDPMNTECQNDRYDVERPTDGKMLAFLLNPQTIDYYYLATRPDTIEFRWDISRDYYGVACLRLQTTDSVRVDSTGNFQLVMDGSNSSFMSRRTVIQGQTIADSVVGYVFRGCEGDGGTYRVLPDSTISFSWRNGRQEGFFAAAGVHKLVGDTIRTSWTVGTPADSVHGWWRLRWGRASCGEGF